MKKILKILPIVICVCIAFTSVAANAIDLPALNRLPGSEANVITETTGTIWKTFVLVAQLLAVLAVVFAGLRYMFAAADRKADIKKSMGMLTLGAILVFGATVVIDVVQRVMFDMAPDNIQTEMTPTATAGIDLNLYKKSDTEYLLYPVMTAGEPIDIEITAKMWGDIGGHESELLWRSTDPSIAQVNGAVSARGEKVTVTIKNNQEAKITVEYEEVKSTIYVKANYNVQHINLSLNDEVVTETTQVIMPGEEKTIILKADINWTTNETIKWTTSNSSIASILPQQFADRKVILLNGSGTVVITAECEGIKATCTINVKKAVFIGVNLVFNDDSKEQYGKKSVSFDYKKAGYSNLKFEDGKTYTVVWDDKEYVCKPCDIKYTDKLKRERVFINSLGNPWILSGSNTINRGQTEPYNTSAPFFIYLLNDNIYIIAKDDNELHTITIYENR